MASEVPLKFTTTTINDLRDDGLFNQSTETASNNITESATVSTTTSTTEIPSTVEQTIGNQGITSISLSTPTSLFPTLESDLTLIECRRYHTSDPE